MFCGVSALTLNGGMARELRVPRAVIFWIVAGSSLGASCAAVAPPRRSAPPIMAASFKTVVLISGPPLGLNGNAEELDPFLRRVAAPGDGNEVGRRVGHDDQSR